jgi:RecB family endonuclease NucS
MRIIKADCEVDYDGRGSTRRGRGARLLILKDDGSFIIHQSTGVKPVNYMSNVTSLTESESVGNQTVFSVESKNGETIDVVIYEKYFDLTIPMEEDTATVTVNGTERQLQEWLSRPENWNKYIGDNIVFIGRELKTLNGSVDLVGYNPAVDQLVIVEVKRKAKKNDTYQVLRYREAIMKASIDQEESSSMIASIGEMMSSTPNNASNMLLTRHSLSDPKCMIVGETEHEGTEEFCAEHGVRVSIVGSNWWGATVDNTIASKTTLIGKSKKTRKKSQKSKGMFDI